MKYCEKLKYLSLNELQNIKNEYEKAYIKSEKYDFNVFSILNLREDSHTELLAWLLNAKNKEKNSIQYQFLRDFLRNDYLDIKNLGIDIFNDSVLDVLISGLEVKIQEPSKDDNGNKNGEIDVFLISKPLNFVCLIEVKLDAKTSINKDEIDQIDRYRSFLEKYYKDYKKCLVFLCAAVDKQVEQKKYISELLNKKTQYQVIEYSDIALIIYNILKNNDNEFSNVKVHNKITYSLLKELSKYLHNDNFSRVKILLDSINNNENILETLITDTYLNTTIKYEKPKNCNLPLLAILNEKNSDIDFIYNLLRQYVQYWEYNNDFVSGYSEIVKGFYIRDILNMLK